MENTSNTSSEEELLQLRAEGKISEDQYKDLLGAVRKAPSKEETESVRRASKSEAKRRGGRLAFTLMLVGLVVPAACFLALQMFAPENASPWISPWFFLGLGLEVAAFVKGIQAWPDMFAQATVITIAVLTIITVLLIA